MTLGQIIKAYRETNNMSMDDFSKASKISKGYISQLENNLNPKTGEPPVPSIQSIKKAANGMFMTNYSLSLTIIRKLTQNQRK